MSPAPPMEIRMFRKWTSILVVTTGNSLLAQQVTPLVTRSAASAPISDVRYEVTFNRETAMDQSARIAMTFVASGNDPILLSLPAWTPGAYEISNFARWVLNLTPTAAGKPLAWDKLDFDTWRIRRDPASTGTVTVAFDMVADTLDNAMAWTRPDFLFFNGTNAFLYAEGRGLVFPSRVIVRTESDWSVATAMTRVAGGGEPTFAAPNYHDLVDMPFFVGRF